MAATGKFRYNSLPQQEFSDPADRESYAGEVMVSVAGKITDEFLTKLKAGSDVRPDQITKLEKLLKQDRAPKVDDLVAIFNLDPPPAKSVEGDAK